MTAAALRIGIGIGMAVAWLALAAGVKAQTVVADLSAHEIKITTGFSGTELLLFGVTEGAGDVIVTVSGPDNQLLVRKKTRVSGIWVNTESVPFNGVPSFFHVATTAGLSRSDVDELLRENGVGFRYQNLAPAENIGPGEANVFREALIRRKEGRRLYSRAPGEIQVVGGALFRTVVPFPANVQVGRYRVDVYHLDDGWVSSTTSIPLTVRKVGLEASLYRFAHDHPAFYGMFAIAVAAVAGYGAGMLFGRR